MKQHFTSLLLLLLLTMWSGKICAQNYYLIGDWSGTSWDLGNKNYKFVSTGTNTYSLYINTPSNTKGSYSLRFVINKEGNTDWAQVFRPRSDGSDQIINNNDITNWDLLKTGNGEAWQLVSNGGSYLLTLDLTNSSQPKWSIQSVPNTRVLYYISETNNWSFNGDYLFDNATYDNIYDTNTNINIVSGKMFELHDGYNKYLQTTGSSTISTFPISTSGSNAIIYSGPSGSDKLEANLTNNTLVVYPKVTVTIGANITEMNYDATNGKWYSSNVSLKGGDNITFSYNNGTDAPSISTQTLAADEEGTYKVTCEMASNSPVFKLLLSNEISYVTPANKYIRTFCDSYARTIPAEVTAYYTSGYSAPTLSLTSITDGIIPANFPVILFYNGSTTNSNIDQGAGFATVSLEKASGAGGTYSNNWLTYEKTSIDLGPVTMDGATPAAVAFRNYYLANMNLDNTVNKLGFYRVASETGTGAIIRKAYLAMPANVQTDSSLDSFSYPTPAKGFATTTSSTTDVTAANRILMLFDGVDLLNTGAATGITNVNSNNNTRSDNAFYTLQGIRVEQPSKGIYIHNGKKVVIK